MHWACIKGASTHFLKTLIENFPQATGIKDYLGRTPIHLSCEFACDHAVFVLLQATGPTVATYRDNNFRRSVLAEAIVNSRSPLIIDAILQANKNQIIMKDFKDNTPLVTFFRKNLGSLLACHSGIFSLVVNSDDLIEIASTLLKAEVEVQMGIELVNHEDVLSNAIKSVSSPFAFVNFILSEMPYQGKIRDINGDLPIHAACRIQHQDEKVYKCDDCGNSQMPDLAYYFSHETTSLRGVLCENCKRSDESNYYRVPPGQKIQSTVEALLDLDEKHGSALSFAGELPLMISLKNGQTWSTGPLEELIHAYPSALSKKDKATGFYPFQLAAIERGTRHGADIHKENRDSLNTIYQLLLMNTATLLKSSKFVNRSPKTIANGGVSSNQLIASKYTPVESRIVSEDINYALDRDATDGDDPEAGKSGTIEPVDEEAVDISNVKSIVEEKSESCEVESMSEEAVHGGKDASVDEEAAESGEIGSTIEEAVESGKDASVDEEVAESGEIGSTIEEAVESGNDASVNEKAVEIGEIEPTVEETVHVDKGMSMDDEATESHKDEPGYGKEDEHIGTVLKDSD